MDHLRSRLGAMCGRGASVSPDDLLSRIYRVTTEMLTDRGLTILERSNTIQGLEQRILAVEPVLTAHAAQDGQRLTRVLYLAEERVAIRTVRQLMEDASEFERTILVSSEGPTPFTNRESVHWGTRVQYFTFKDLLVNVTRHACVPQHRLFTGIREFPDAQYPKILTSDRVVQHYDFQPGELVEIERRFAVCENGPYLRIVAVA